jgi:hypothetical protein
LAHALDAETRDINCSSKGLVNPQWQSRARSYSKTDWETLIRLTLDDCEWSSIEPAVVNLQQNTTCKKMVRFPLSLAAANGIRVHTAAACYGCLWLVCHEAIAVKGEPNRYEIFFNAPVKNGRIVYSINWLKGRYILEVFAQKQSKVFPRG